MYAFHCISENTIKEAKKQHAKHKKREQMFILQRSAQCLSAIVTPVSVKVFKESMNV
jgi:hypothetical protein